MDKEYDLNAHDEKPKKLYELLNRSPYFENKYDSKSNHASNNTHQNYQLYSGHWTMLDIPTKHIQKGTVSVPYTDGLVGRSITFEDLNHPTEDEFEFGKDGLF